MGNGGTTGNGASNPIQPDRPHNKRGSGVGAISGRLASGGGVAPRNMTLSAGVNTPISHWATLGHSGGRLLFPMVNIESLGRPSLVAAGGGGASGGGNGAAVTVRWEQLSGCDWQDWQDWAHSHHSANSDAHGNVPY